MPAPRVNREVGVISSIDADEEVVQRRMSESHLVAGTIVIKYKVDQVPSTSLGSFSPDRFDLVSVN